MKALWGGLVVAGLLAGLCTSYGARATGETPAVDTRIFELRTYHAAPGKMEGLHERFRDHTCKLFEKHGMTVVGFWSPTKPAEADKTLIYILSYPSKEAADRSWKAFREDPDWVKAKSASEKNGTLVTRVESVYMTPTDYSPLK